MARRPCARRTALLPIAVAASYNVDHRPQAAGAHTTHIRLGRKIVGDHRSRSWDCFVQLSFPGLGNRDPTPSFVWGWGKADILRIICDSHTQARTTRTSDLNAYQPESCEAIIPDLPMSGAEGIPVVIGNCYLGQGLANSCRSEKANKVLADGIQDQ